MSSEGERILLDVRPLLLEFFADLVLPSFLGHDLDSFNPRHLTLRCWLLCGTLGLGTSQVRPFSSLHLEKDDASNEADIFGVSSFPRQ